MKIVSVFAVKILLETRKRYGKQKLLSIIVSQIILEGYHHMSQLVSALVKNLYVKRNIVNVLMQD